MVFRSLSWLFPRRFSSGPACGDPLPTRLRPGDRSCLDRRAGSNVEGLGVDEHHDGFPEPDWPCPVVGDRCPGDQDLLQPGDQSAFETAVVPEVISTNCKDLTRLESDVRKRA